MPGIAGRKGDITTVEIIENAPASRIYFESICRRTRRRSIADLERLSVVRAIEQVETFEKIYGKRIIIMGGGAQ